MNELRNVEIIIWGKRYNGVKDTHGTRFINLTANEIVVCSQEHGNGIGPLIIPKGGYVAYLSVDDFFIGIPPVLKNTYFVVEYSLARVLQRKDLCISVECDFTQGRLGLLPIKEPKRVWGILAWKRYSIIVT